jgi:cytoskeleton protein RodZ
MSDEQDNPAADETRDNGPCGGERLAQARRERQITVLEVAKELHLDEPKVRALERNDFDVLGAPVFAKGHLRKYAQLVGVDEADVFADYYAMTRTSALPPVVVGRVRIRNEFSPGPWIAVLAVLAVAAGAYWWFVEREQPAPVQPEPFQPETIEPAVSQVQEPVTKEPVAKEPVAKEPVTKEPVADVATPEQRQPNIQAAAAVAPPAADSQISLSIAFSGECWTEIIDADGRKLFFNMGNTGQLVNVRGRAPISALFGNADNVSVQVNGSNYALPAARNANGTLRVAIVSP